MSSHTIQDGFVFQKRYQKKPRPKPTVGVSTQSKVKGEIRKTDLFLYRVTRDTADNNILKMFEEAKIQLYDFELVSHKDAKLKSYRIKVSLNDTEKICDVNFLPENVMCRRFYRPRPGTDMNMPDEHNLSKST